MHQPEFSQLKVALLLLTNVAFLVPSALGELKINPANGWKAFEVISQGDNPAGDGEDYSMPGSFDGAGAYQLDANTLRVQVNHELSGAATVSEVDLDIGILKTAIANIITTGNTGGLDFVVRARRAYTRWHNGSTWSTSGLASFTRFCSAGAHAPNTFGTDRGFVDEIYLTNEEGGGERLFAIDSLSRDFYQISGTVGSGTNDGGGVGGFPFDAYENSCLLDTGETGHIALILSADGGTRKIRLYIGIKGKDEDNNNSTSFLARNGLAYGSHYNLIASYPDLGSTNNGTFSTSDSGVLDAAKNEDVDTFHGDPTRFVLGNQVNGVYTFTTDLNFAGGSFNAGSSSFTISKIVHASGDISAADNVDWTDATTLSTRYSGSPGGSHSGGLIFVNEDGAGNQAWIMEPDGSNETLCGTSTSGEVTGVFDISEWLGYVPSSIMIQNNQGSSSMAVMVNPNWLNSDPGALHTGSGWYQVGDTVQLTLGGPFSAGSAVWRDNQGVIIEGETGQSVTFENVTLGQSGTYTCTYDNGTKSVAVATFNVEIFDGLPVSGVIGLGFLSGILALTGATVARRRKEKM